MQTIYTVYSQNVQRSTGATPSWEPGKTQWQLAGTPRVLFTGYYLECINRMAQAVATVETIPGYQVHKDWRPGMYVLEPGQDMQEHVLPWVVYMEPGRPASAKEPEPGTVSAGIG